MLDSIKYQDKEVAVQADNGVWHVKVPDSNKWIPCVFKEDAQSEVNKLYKN